MRALQHGLALLNKLPVSLRFIREVHGVLMEGVRGGQEMPGEFRRNQNFIKSDGPDIHSARYVPPPVTHLEETLRSLETFLNQEQSRDKDPLLVQIALIHYQFEAIHPFRDGNGRWLREPVAAPNGQPPPGVPADAAAQEREWICYAWPNARTQSGNRAFMVNHAGDVYATPNTGTNQKYSGTTCAPKPGAALTACGAVAITAKQRIAGDGGTWVPAGN